MARPVKPNTEKKIEKLLQEMMQLKKKYDEQRNSEDLMSGLILTCTIYMLTAETLEAERKYNLIKAISKSDLTYEDLYKSDESIFAGRKRNYAYERRT